VNNNEMGPRRAVVLSFAPLCLLILLSACAAVHHEVPLVSNGPLQVGIASWYGPGFHGRRTASGKIYNQYDLTAAHRTLPFGTPVRVTHLQSGASVDVRITDRGPFVGGRIIDLSYAAARKIGLIQPGIGKVRLELLDPAAPAPPMQYAVQVGPFREHEHASAARQMLAEHFPESHVVRIVGARGPFYRVRVGPYPLRGVARARATELGDLGWSAAVVVQDPRPQ
jgi:rare lipoprotein A